MKHASEIYFSSKNTNMSLIVHIELIKICLIKSRPVIIKKHALFIRFSHQNGNLLIRRRRKSD